VTTTIRELVLTSNILVCCGAGGVGKTTVATGLALAGAREGRKVLALTVDPSRRLAQTLGVERNLAAPVSVADTWLAEAGISGDAVLDAWMLSPKRVADRAVKRFALSPDQFERLMNNRVYKHVTRMVAGMQEYTAMQAVHDFVEEGRYDLIVLDTPPSRNALDFLDGPQRLRRFFDGRIFKLFLPGEGKSTIRAAARALLGRVLGAIFGPENYDELQEFFSSFQDLFNMLTRNAGRMLEMLSDEQKVAFLLVTTPAPESITDAMFFQRKTDTLGLPFRGFVLNRSNAVQAGRKFPDEELFPGGMTPVATSALAKLQQLAELERAEMMRDQRLLDDLDHRAGDEAFADALPLIPGGVDDMDSLVRISDALMGW
jgi:anion-transporting  ArsA/GET3 family ATPase